MASPSSSPSSVLLILLTLATPLLLGLITSSQVQAKSDESDDPVPVSTDLIAILDKGGQYKTFIRLLASTQVSNQISNQLRSSDQGTTVFAPTDNAFNSLKPGTLNGLSVQQQVGLVLYHVLAKYYSLDMFEAVSNPVRTQATGQDGGAYNLNFTSNPNQVNVSTGVVAIQLNNALQQRFPLAVYEVDKVLLPLDLFGPKPKPHKAPVPAPVLSVPVPVPAPALAPPPLTKDKKSPSSTVTVSSGSASKMDLALMGGLGLVAMSVLTY